MSTYQLRYSTDFLRLLHKLPGDIRAVANQKVKLLVANPLSTQAKELDGHPGYYRLWLPRSHRLFNVDNWAWLAHFVALTQGGLNFFLARVI
jgi:hypothetical protein